MRKFTFIFSFLLIANFSFAQVNLVPNFSFEQYSTCPSSQDQIQYAVGWSKYSQLMTTPDYYHACADYSSGYSVPLNGYCNQPSHRGCNAYAGLVIYFQNGYRENIGIQLSTALSVGQKYFISFYTVMGEFVNSGHQFGMPSNNIGMRLSTIQYNSSNPVPIDNFAHLNSSAIISDSVNWIRISGSIIADSAYNYLILGNFFDNSNTDTLHYTCGTCLNFASYYLIDDICVSTDSLLANGGIDILPCITSVNEIFSDDEIRIFQNPVSDMVTISFQSNVSDEIILTDVYGKILYVEGINNESSIIINLSNYSSGVYVLKIVNQKEKKSATKKIIKL